MELLEALLASWLQTETTVELGSDPDKVGLLKRVAEVGVDSEPSPIVRDIYREVFLRDIWNQGLAAGETAD